MYLQAILNKNYFTSGTFSVSLMLQADRNVQKLNTPNKIDVRIRKKITLKRGRTLNTFNGIIIEALILWPYLLKSIPTPQIVRMRIGI